MRPGRRPARSGFRQAFQVGFHLRPLGAGLFRNRLQPVCRAAGVQCQPCSGPGQPQFNSRADAGGGARYKR